MEEKNATGLVVLTAEYWPFPGGIATYAGQISKAVARYNRRVSVIAPRYEGACDEVGDGIKVHRVLKHHGIPLTSLPRFLKLLRARPKDIILAADIRSVLALYALRFLHKRPYRAMVHGSEASKADGKSFLWKQIRKAYLHAECVLYNSQATQTIFRNAVGIPRHEAVTYLGVDDHWFASDVESFDNRELQGIPADAQVVCSVGRIEARKGQFAAVRAIARIAEERPSDGKVIYVIAGRPEDESYTRMVLEEAKRSGVSLIAPGRLSDADLKALFRRSACHLLLAQDMPGRIEGFGLVLLEAAAQGCPSISTRVGGIPEVMGETGLIVDAADESATVEAICRYLFDPEFRRVSGYRSLERARGFTWKACAQKSFPEICVSP